MELTYITIAVSLAALAVAAAVSVVTRLIIDRQQKLAAQINQLAGVTDIRTLPGAGPKSLHDVLATRPPQGKLDIWAVSGWTLFQSDTLERLLRKGIRVRALLLDPNAKLPLLPHESWLQHELRNTLDRACQLSRDFPQLIVRLYQGLPAHLLLFVDDDRVFVSSYFPVASKQRLVFEIAPGERSLYQLYREAFEYSWSRSQAPEAANG